MPRLQGMPLLNRVDPKPLAEATVTSWKSGVSVDPSEYGQDGSVCIAKHLSSGFSFFEIPYATCGSSLDTPFAGVLVNVTISLSPKVTRWFDQANTKTGVRWCPWCLVTVSWWRSQVGPRRDLWGPIDGVSEPALRIRPIRPDQNMH